MIDEAVRPMTELDKMRKNIMDDTVENLSSDEIIGLYYGFLVTGFPAPETMKDLKTCLYRRLKKEGFE